MQLRSFFFIWSQLRLLRFPFWTTITILFVGCNKDSEQLFFLAKNAQNYKFVTLYCVRVSITGASLQFCFSFFFHITMKESMITVRLQYYINSTRALFLAAEVTRVFFFFHLISRSHFSHPNFTNCKLHTRMLTDTDLWRVRCSPIDSGITHKVKKTRDPK